jgi:flagellin-like hook-associated protein FlgL
MTIPISPTNLLVNVGSLRGQQALQRADSALAISIRNLSSGVRIHTGRDDPIGFIASTAMKTDITSLSQAVSNCQRADSVIATVDSALSHINNLLNDLRGLVSQAANTGGEVPETLASLQIQADAIIDTINFISATTSFQGHKLLDGSLDFNTFGLDSDKISQLNIYQANFQGHTEKDIVVKVYEPGRQGELYYPYGVLKTDTVLTIGGTGGHASFSFDKDATVQNIADAVNLISDSTGIGASVFSKSNPGSIILTSYGKNNNVLVTASEPGTAAGNFVFRYTAPREGNDEMYLNVTEGDGNNPTVVEVVLQTEPGGTVLTTAEQVITLLNTSPLLKHPDGTGRVTAAIPTGETGLGTVTPFSEVGFYGDPQANNYLQFLAPPGSPPITFVSTPGTPLSVDDTTHPPVYANAIAQVQGFESGTSFTLRSLIPGPEGDNVKIIFRDSPNESAEYDPISKSVIFSVDFTGRADDPYRDDFSMEDLKQLVRDNPEVNNRFSVQPHASYPFDNPPTFSSSAYRGIDAQLGATSGGVVSPGYLVVHLETDENGMIKTTANDLVKFFNSPSTEESKAVLDRWGISVACIDPTSSSLTACTIGQASFGVGLLGPTYDPFDCPIPDTGYPDIHFSSYGNNIREGYATATITSNGSRNADWTLSAKNIGAAYNNVSVTVVDDFAGPALKYDPVLKQLTVGIHPYNPITAEEIVALINSDPELSVLFAASLPPHSDGQGFVVSGDRAVLTGGILPVDTRSEGSIIASGGINSTFSVQSIHANAQYHNTEIIVVPDSSGPKVSYDPQAKQLTIGVAPGDPQTAQQIIDLINSTPGVSELFVASLPTFADKTSVVPDGSGLVHVGDFGVMQATTTGASMGAAMLGATDNESLGIVFHSVKYGSKEFVDVWATYGDLSVVDRFGIVTERAYGTDIVADINNRAAIGDGRTAMSTTSELDIAITTDPTVRAGDVFGFRISGGGALMQLGPQASWTQQVRVAIKSVHSTVLGGESGTLSQLKTDEPYSLLKDTSRAFHIIEESMVELTITRGRLGALQRSRIETSMEHMTDAVNIASEARSTIADVEFASESSEFARQQLLMQTSISVLQQSSQMKQMLLSLLKS